jgi:uncharacterized protein
LYFGYLLLKIQGMWHRQAAQRLNYLASAFPAVLVLGPRQVGKTTLVRATFPHYPYVDLESPRVAELFREDPVFHIQARANPNVILDEAQAVPSVFTALRGIIDDNRKVNGRFILLGSAQPTLVRGVSESLAGRVGILDLSPLTVQEVSDGTLGFADVWLRGGFPDALSGSDFRMWWESYLRSYLERDLPQLGLNTDPVFTRRLLTMLAHSQGGILNVSTLCDSLGVGRALVERCLDVFEGTYLLRRLPPFFRNVGKRLVKSPKIYLRDSGLLHHLLNISSQTELDAHPIRGASWETFVLEDLLRRESLVHPSSQAFFWRTAAGAEIDLIIDRGSSVAAIEIKSAQVANRRFVRTLADAMVDVDAKQAYFVDQGKGRAVLAPGIERVGIEEAVSWLP